MPDSESVSLDTDTSCSVRSDGLSQLTATIFVVGAVAGVGVLALPHAMSDSGWTGIVVVICGAIASGYSGSRLGTCWTILEERWDVYKEQTRNPYPCIAYRAFGTPMKAVTSGFQVLGLFGYGAVFLILAADLVSDISKQLSHSGFHFSRCYWLIILAFLLVGLMWLGTPKDFCFAGFGALGATMIACVVVIIVCVMDLSQSSFPRAVYRTPSAYTFFRAFGTIMFAYGGTAQFPTIQNDMKDRRQFPSAVLHATVVLVVLYATVCGLGYGTFGSNVRENILQAVGEGVVSISVECLFIVHLICAFLILINPMCQEVEEHLKIPKEFTWKRVAVRTTLMVAILCVSETVPHFNKVLSLVGAVVVGITTFILPPIFYLRLCRTNKPEWPERHLPLWEHVLVWELVVFGVVATIAGTVTSVEELVKPGAFSIPCFVDPSVYT